MKWIFSLAASIANAARILAHPRIQIIRPAPRARHSIRIREFLVEEPRLVCSDVHDVALPFGKAVAAAPHVRANRDKVQVGQPHVLRPREMLAVAIKANAQPGILSRASSEAVQEGVLDSAVWPAPNLLGAESQHIGCARRIAIEQLA